MNSVRISIFRLFFLFCSLFAFFSAYSADIADPPTCVVEPDGDGWKIVCSVDQHPVQPGNTNETGELIGYCREIKDALFNKLDDIDNKIDVVESCFSMLDNDWNNFNYFYQSGYIEPSKAGDYYDALYQFRDDKNDIYSFFLDVRDGVGELRSIVDDVVCTNCDSSAGSGTCCATDIVPILQKLQEIYDKLDEINDNLFELKTKFVQFFDVFKEYVGFMTNQFAVGTFSYSTEFKGKGTINDQGIFRIVDFKRAIIMPDASLNLISQFFNLNRNLYNFLGSINSYFYDFDKNIAPPITNTLNRFSFFTMGQKSVMYYYDPQEGSYYDFLTNHYLTISSPNGVPSNWGERGKYTNWFQRVEVLLAALVFQDAAGSNYVDSAFGESEINSIQNSLSGLSSAPASQLNVFSSVGEGLVSRVRSYSSAFSSAADPGTIRLVNLSVGPSSSDGEVSFQSSEMSALVEACRAVTTILWCLSGLFLLWWFLHWTVQTCYNLFLFCYDVVSAIFHH